MTRIIMGMKGYFGSPSYETPAREKMRLCDRIILDSRIYFTLKYARVVLKTRHQARSGVYDDAAWADSSIYILRFIEKAGGRFILTGMDHIAEDPEPVIFIGNHMSTLETMVLPGLIAPLRRVTFVVKESLVKHPLFGDVMRSRDPIVVGRTDPRKDLEAVMNGGAELLKKGISLVIFPQSTRSLVFKPEEFNSLGVKLAKKTGVKVVPVALRTDYWMNGRIIKELGPIDHRKTIHIRFGEPFSVSGTGKEDNQKIIDFIQTALEEWGTI